MQLSEILSTVDEQSAGRWFEALHPVTGEAAGLRLKLAGPDSRQQAEALAIMTDELAEAADAEGRVTGQDREAIRRRFLARIVLDWEATEDGKPVPFSFSAVLRLMGVAWVRSQVDAYGAARAPYFVGADDAEA